MAHTIQFDKTFDGFILSKEEVRDIIDLFYRWGDSNFMIFCDEKEKKFRGEHMMVMGIHNIKLSSKNIKKDFQLERPIGGNLKAPTLKVAAAMVIVHELQHANQTRLHLQSEKFYTKKGYWNRACEREAREYVDAKMAEICAYFDAPYEGRRGVAIVSNGEANKEAQDVAALLMECHEVTFEDIKDELRASKILNPMTFMFVANELKKNGYSQMMDVFSRTSVV